MASTLIDYDKELINKARSLANTNDVTAWVKANASWAPDGDIDSVTALAYALGRAQGIMRELVLTIERMDRDSA